jgi:hypothetical protein
MLWSCADWIELNWFRWIDAAPMICEVVPFDWQETEFPTGYIYYSKSHDFADPMSDNVSQCPPMSTNVRQCQPMSANVPMSTIVATSHDIYKWSFQNFHHRPTGSQSSSDSAISINAVIANNFRVVHDVYTICHSIFHKRCTPVWSPNFGQRAA